MFINMSFNSQKYTVPECSSEIDGLVLLGTKKWLKFKVPQFTQDTVPKIVLEMFSAWYRIQNSDSANVYWVHSIVKRL